MSVFLEEWVETRLGISINFNEIGDAFFDGSLFFKILQSYDVVGPEIKEHFRRADSPQDALKNLNLLRISLKLLNVLHNDDVLAEISKKNGAACIDLLNELYLKLSNKHSLPLASNAKELQISRNETGRFHKTKVKEKQCVLAREKKPEETLLSRLQTNVKLFNREPHNFSSLSVSNKMARDSQSRLEETSKKAKEELEKSIKECKCSSNIEDCLKKFDEKLDLQAAGDSAQNICPGDYIKMLKLRVMKQSSNKEIEEKLKENVVKWLWCKHMKKREEEFRCSLAEKLLKQSNYEKEMEKRLGQIHMQHNLMMEKRRKVHEEAQRIYHERLVNIEWRKDSCSRQNWIDDKDRLEELHYKIYSKKVAKAHENNLEMAKDIVNDLIDFSIKICIFELENSMKVPYRESQQWKALFYKGLPLFSNEKERIVSEEECKTESESAESFDSLLELDENVEQALNEHDLNDYLILLGPWMKELWTELQDKDEEQLVLGFVVHRLLEAKYPLAPPPNPVDIPYLPIRCVLNNFMDGKSIKTLRSLLEKARIEIIELSTLIGSCISAYKIEAGIGVKSSKKTGKETKEEKVKKKNGKEKKSSIVQEPNVKSVEVQFPSIIDTEPKMSKYSELGKMAFEILGSGAPVPGTLIMDILIEFLKNLSDREGWLLLNYPSDCRQVHLIESMFTGVQPPIKCILENEKEMVEPETSNISEIGLLGEDFEKDEDEDLMIEASSIIKLNELRVSRLVPRPNPAPPVTVFESYFTNYIQIDNDKLTNLNENKSKLKGESLTGEMQEVGTIVENDDEEQTPQSFYSAMGNYKYFSYNKLDLLTLKRLARVILNEIDEAGPERKSSFELFGEVGVNEARKKTSKASVRRSVSKKSKKPLSESMTGEADKNQEALTPAEPPLVDELEIIPCQVAEPCWQFTTLEFSIEQKVALASFWESIEIAYIQNLIELFSIYRVHDKTVVPYRNLIYKKLLLTMEEPDDRQLLVDEFQLELNNLHDTLRGLGDIKKEFFCKIFELQLKLWDLCDTKKMTSEIMRKNIINQNWFPDHISSLFNLYVSMMETEFDRFLDTLQLLQVYYLSCMGKPVTLTRSEKYLLPRYKSSDFVPQEDETRDELPKDSTTESERDTTKTTSLKMSQKSSLIKCELDFNLISSGISEQFAEFFTIAMTETSFNSLFIDNMNGLANKIESEAVNLITPHLAIIEKEKKAFVSQKSPTSKKNKGGKKVSKISSNNAVPMVEEQLKKMELQNALFEWEKALQNEIDRLHFRITLIKNRFNYDLDELQDLFMDTFHGLYNEISTRYFEQTKSCDNLIRVLMSAVEAESNIEPKLILTLNEFCLETKKKRSLQIDCPPVTPIEETDKNLTFTVEQLTRFAEKMISVSPLGVTIETLIAVIEDMVLIGRENGYPYLPKGWSEFTRNDIRKLIQNVFGEVVSVDWKDLLVLALEFRFPTLEEIIDARNKFIELDPQRTENINLKDFNSVILWFEKDLCDSLEGDLRVALGKNFLFNLYRVDKELMNYTAFLLNFCKDEYPIDGFGKALALITGTGYVLSQEKLYLLDQKLEVTESYVIAEQIINILLQDTLNRAEGIVITEVDDDGNTIRETESEFVKSDYGFFKAEKILDTAEQNLETVSRSSKQSIKSRLRSQTKSRTSETFPIINSQSLASEKSTNDEVEKLKTNIIWKSWIPRSLLVSLLLTSLLSFSLPEDQFYIQTELENQVQSIYGEKGIDDCLQGHILAQSVFIKDLLSKCNKFKSSNLSLLTKSILDSKELIINH